MKKFLGALLSFSLVFSSLSPAMASDFLDDSYYEEAISSEANEFQEETEPFEELEMDVYEAEEPFCPEEGEDLAEEEADEITDNLNASAATAPQITASATSVTLDPAEGGREIVLSLTGDFPGRFEMLTSVTGTCFKHEWTGDWYENNRKHNITLTGLSSGTGALTVLVRAVESGETLATVTINVTVSAQGYTISYNANGGTKAPSSQSKQYDKDISLSATAPKKSYTITYEANGGLCATKNQSLACEFLGWNTNAAGTGTNYKAGEKYTANADLSLFAKWGAAHADAMPVPVRANHNFMGWFTAIEGGTEVTASTAIQNDIMVYAQWRSLPSDALSVNNSKVMTITDTSVTRKYTFTPEKSGYYRLVTEGSLDPKIQLLDANKKLLKSDDNSGEEKNIQLDYYFTAGNTYNVELSFNSGSETGDLRLKALQGFTLTYDARGGTGAPAAQTFYYMIEDQISQTTPTRTGYVFNGWYTAPSGGAKLSTSTTLTADKTIYARWSLVSSELLTVNSTKTLTITSSEEERRYTFTPSVTGKYRFVSFGDLDTKITLTNTSTNQKITDDDSGDERNFRLDYDLTAGTTYYVDVVLYKTSDVGTFTFKLLKGYNLTYDANGGTDAPAVQVGYYGTPLTLMRSTPRRTGYTFEGWYTDPNGGTKVGSTITLENNVTVYAHWAVPVAGELQVNGTTMMNLTSATERKRFYYTPAATGRYCIICNSNVISKITLLSETEQVLGYSTTGEKSDEIQLVGEMTAGNTYYVDTAVKNGLTSGTISVVLLKEYTLTYNANGGTGAPSSQTGFYGNTINLSTKVPTKAGYSFDGWYTSASAGTKMPSSIPLNGNTTLYAHWKELPSFLVAYHLDDGSDAAATSKVIYGTSTKTKTIAELGFAKTGKAFAGWKVYREDIGAYRMINGSGTQSWANSVPANGDFYLYADGVNVAQTTPAGTTVHFYAQWKSLDEFTVAYHIDEQAAVAKTSQVKYGTATTTKTVSQLGFAKSGKTFAGWKVYREDIASWRVVDSKGTQSWSKTLPSGGNYYLYADGVSVGKTTPAGTTVHFYGQWKDSQEFTIAYHIDDASEATRTSIVRYGTTTATQTVAQLGFSKAGKQFAGWKVYREDIASWRVVDSKGVQSWSKSLPVGGDLYYYADGVSVARTTPAGTTVHFYAVWTDATKFSVEYHLDDAAPATAMYEVIYGTATATKTVGELGFTKSGYSFTGWKVYRADIDSWRVMDSKGVQSWAKTVPAGGSYVLYANGVTVSKTTPGGTTVHFYGQWKNTSTFTIAYHSDDKAAVGATSQVTYGTATATKKVEQLGFSKSGCTFSGWKIYREDIDSWRVADSKGTQSWSKNVPAGGSYVLYANGTSVGKTTPAGTTVHFYAQWEDNTRFTIAYHLDENAAVGATSQVVFGTATTTKKSYELGFSKSGKIFTGWKVYREDIESWRVADSKGTQSWSKTLPVGGSYVIYADGVSVGKTTPVGTTVHFYGQWK